MAAPKATLTNDELVALLVKLAPKLPAHAYALGNRWRLLDLERAGWIAHRERDGWRLTPEGEALYAHATQA